MIVLPPTPLYMASRLMKPIGETLQRQDVNDQVGSRLPGVVVALLCLAGICGLAIALSLAGFGMLESFLAVIVGVMAGMIVGWMWFLYGMSESEGGGASTLEQLVSTSYLVIAPVGSAFLVLSLGVVPALIGLAIGIVSLGVVWILSPTPAERRRPRLWAVVWTALTIVPALLAFGVASPLSGL